MIYLTSAGKKLRVIILETGNLERLKAGHPLKTPDESVLIAWTPDPAWLAEQIAKCDGSGPEIARLIDEASKRPEQPTRPYFEPEVKKIGPAAGGKS